MIVGVTGRAGSGKDTVADVLVKEHGFVKIALADEIKRICRKVFDFSEEQLWGASSKRNEPDRRYPRDHSSKLSPHCECCGVDMDVFWDTPCYLTPRYALQQLGTEWGRNCYKNVWVDLTLRVAEELLKGSYRDDSGGMGGASYDAKTGVTFYPAVDWLEPVRGVVISDVRFPNEVLAIRAKLGKIWKTSHGDGLTGAAGAHESESYIDRLNVDYILPRVGLERVPEEVKRALEETFR